MRLILVRHAESVANVQQVNQGQRQGELTARGRAQAAALATKLATQGITRIYASDLHRVQQTLHPLTELIDAPVIPAPALREQDMGIYEGSPYGSVMAAARDAEEELYSFHIPDGESIQERSGRVTAFFRRLVEEFRETEEVVCCFTHGGVIIDALLLLLEQGQERALDFQHANAACTQLAITPDEVTVLALNTACGDENI